MMPSWASHAFLAHAGQGADSAPAAPGQGSAQEADENEFACEPCQPDEDTEARWSKAPVKPTQAWLISTISATYLSDRGASTAFEAAVSRLAITKWRQSVPWNAPTTP